MSDSTSTNDSMIWCAKTGELQSLKSLLKDVRLTKTKTKSFVRLFASRIQVKSMN